MKYIRKFEIFDQNFENGDIVLCIDDSNKGGSNGDELKFGKKYQVIGTDYPLICVRNLKNNKSQNWYKHRFIYPKDFEEWTIENDAKNKYNLL